MRDLEHLDGREVELRGDIRLGIRGEEDVGRAVRREHHDRVQVRILARHRAPVRPEDAHRKPAEPKHLAGPCPLDPHARRRGRDRRAPLVRPPPRLARVEELTHAEPADDLGGAADVVPVRMRQDDRGERADPQPPQLRRDAGLRRSGVDEDRPLPDLEQLGVPLPHVEERHAQTRRRRPRRARAGDGPRERDRPSGEHGDEDAAPSPPRCCDDRGAGAPDPREDESSAKRVDLCAGQLRDETCGERDPGGRPPSEPRQRDRRRRQQGRDHRSREAEPEERRDRRLRQRVREDAPQRHAAEVEPEDRGRPRPAGHRDRERSPDHLREHERERQRLQPPVDARHDDEDRGDGCERQLEARVEQRRRVPDEEHERAEGEEVPAVPLPRGEPGERRQRAGDGSPHDGRLPADGERVRGDGADGRDLRERP